MKTKFRIPVMLLMVAMLSTMLIVSCKNDDDDNKTPATDFTALNASIAAAQTVLTASVEGKADGQYPTGSKTALQTAVTTAQALAASPATTQVQADAATSSLNTAVTTFQGLVNKPIAAENLVAHWTFDEGTGTTAADVSGNNFNGTFKAGPVHAKWPGAVMPTWGADRAGTANKGIHFAGGNIEVPYNTKLNPTTAITVAVWVKQDSLRADNRFLGLQSWIGYKFQLQDGLKPFFTIAYTGDDGSLQNINEDANVGVPLHEWHHIAVTYTASSMVFYIDGVKTITRTEPNVPMRSISDKPYNLTIGQDFPTDKYYMGAADNDAFNDPTNAGQYRVIPVEWGGFYAGSLDELRIYNIALSESQIAQLYTQEQP